MNKSITIVHSLPELIPHIVEISETAGNEILNIYNSGFSISHKDDRSPLTAADLAAHKLICEKLSEINPEIPVLSEESASIPFSERKLWDKYWLVDPLDGTKEFIKRNGDFTVNIALIEGNNPVLGVVHVPVKGVTYFASKKYGAYKKSGTDTPVQIFTKKTSKEKIIIAGSSSHANEKLRTFVKSIANVEFISIGSSLKFCLVANGLVDIYPRFGPTSEWDTAAAQCIVEESGGMVTDVEFNILMYNTRESLINPDFLVIADKTFNWKPYLSL